MRDTRGAGPGRFASIEELLHRVATGDREAFIALYDAMSARVFGLTRHVLVDPSQAEEVTQEVFLEIWRTAARYHHERGAAVSWMLTIARRRAIDRVRASQSSRERDYRIGSAQLEREYDSVSEHIESVDMFAQVRSRMADLTTLQRQAVELTYLAELSYAEISDLLKIPIGTVKTRVRDGLARLRKEFAASA